jgi:hypothetical protein
MFFRDDLLFNRKGCREIILCVFCAYAVKSNIALRSRGRSSSAVEGGPRAQSRGVKKRGAQRAPLFH